MNPKSNKKRSQINPRAQQPKYQKQTENYQQIENDDFSENLEEEKVDEEEIVDENQKKIRIKIPNPKKEYFNFFRKYKIQDVIKPRQVILVQINKEERGLKGAALTTFLSFNN